MRLDSGEPVADAQVRLFDMTDLRQGAIARATTDGTGYFALPLAALRGSALPTRFALGPNYPNPFNPSTIIPYQLAASSAVRLEVFNLLGQRIATLVDGVRPAGFHTATWHATDAAGRAVGASVYIYRMTVGVESQTGRMVLIDGQAGVAAGGIASDWLGASGGGSAEEQVYGLIVSGEGLVPFVDSAFRVEAGMAPVELVVSAGPHSAGKATDDDCAFCDLFDALNDDEEGLAPAGKALATLAAPAAPTNLRFEAVTDSSCRVRWDAVAGATDYDVNYKPAVGGKWTNEPHRGTRLYTTIYDLEPNTEYRWAVRAENRDGPSEWVFGPNFTTLGADGGVHIPDAKLRAAIAKALGKASGATITKGEMLRLRALKAEDVGISDLTGLEFATNLTDLDLDFNAISDISPLRGLTNLKDLDLDFNAISDISPLRSLTNLTWLALWGNAISDVSPLRGLTNLKDLDLKGNILNASSINVHIPALKRSGTTVLFDPPFREKGDFDIELVFLSTNFSESHKRVIRYAARRWMSIIREDLPDYTLTEGWSDMCGDHSYAIPAGERIDDLRIYVTSYDDRDDDAAAGWGGPHFLRETSHLSVGGCMRFNLNDNFVSLTTALHEIGHVLGFGTIWDYLGFLQNPSENDPNADTHFNGPLAIAAFNKAGGRDYAGAKVPVHRQGGPSADSHWRDSVLKGELMEPWGGTGALSAITIQSLADLGYVVDVTQADPYTLPRASAKVSAAAKPSLAGDDRWPGRLAPKRTCGVGQHQEPIYVVDPQGRVIRTLHR